MSTATRIRADGKKIKQEDREARLKRLNAAVTAIPVWGEIPRVMYTTSFRNILELMYPDRKADIQISTSVNGPVFSLLINE